MKYSISKKVILASFSYKGITIKLTDDCLPTNIVQILEQAYLGLKDECKVESQLYFDQLDMLIENQHLFKDLSYYWLFINNIYTLVELGLLKQDDNNGTFFLLEWESIRFGE